MLRSGVVGDIGETVGISLALADSIAARGVCAAGLDAGWATSWGWRIHSVRPKKLAM
jgi:hypothetical protein